MSQWLDDQEYNSFRPAPRERCELCGGIADNVFCATCETKAFLLLQKEKADSMKVGDRILAFDARGDAFQATVFSTVHLHKINGLDEYEAVTIALDGIPRLVEWPVNDTERIKDE